MFKGKERYYARSVIEADNAVAVGAFYKINASEGAIVVSARFYKSVTATVFVQYKVTKAVDVWYIEYPVVG